MKPFVPKLSVHLKILFDVPEGPKCRYQIQNQQHKLYFMVKKVKSNLLIGLFEVSSQNLSVTDKANNDWSQE